MSVRPALSLLVTGRPRLATMTLSKASSLVEDKITDVRTKPTVGDPDAEFGGHEARRKLERGLLRKLDIRMSILIFIYVLNCVRL